MRSEQPPFFGQDVTIESTSASEPDLSKYAQDIAHFDFTDQQQRELLDSLWTIASAFVQMGLDSKSCGKFIAELLVGNDEPQSVVDSFRSNAKVGPKSENVESENRCDRT